jgi:hypothetical protein
MTRLKTMTNMIAVRCLMFIFLLCDHGHNRWLLERSAKLFMGFCCPSDSLAVSISSAYLEGSQIYFP